MNARLMNVGIRGITVLSRLALIYFLTLFYKSAEVGLFGTIVATVLMCALVVSLNFKFYLHREIASASNSGVNKYVGNTLAVIFFSYIVFMPIIGIFFAYDIFKAEFILEHYVLIVLVHLALEVEGLLIVLRRQIQASWVFFWQTAGWVYLLLAVLLLVPNVHIRYVLWAWILGAASALCYGVFCLRDTLVLSTLARNLTLNWNWVKKGIRVSAVFLIITFSLKGMFTFDRYVIEYNNGYSLLGVYVLYASLIYGAFNFAEPAIFSFAYPRLLKAGKHRGINYCRYLRELAISTVAFSSLMLLTINIIFPHAVQYFFAEEYISSIYIIPGLSIVGFLFTLGNVPHYGLYALNSERHILVGNVLGLIVFIALVLNYETSFAMDAVVNSLQISFAAVLIYKIGALYLTIKGKLFVSEK